MSLVHLIYVYIAFVLGVSSSLAKNYLKGGADWQDPTCNPAINESVSPINIATKSAVCSTSYVVDILFHKGESQAFRFSYGGEPKTISMKFPIKSFDIMVRFQNGHIVKYRARELMPRVPSEHSIDGVRAAAELQFRFKADKMYRDVTVNQEIILSIFIDNHDESTTKGFFHKLVKKLGTIPTSEMLSGDGANPKVVVMDSPINLNTFYTRPIGFWAYNGTYTYGDCSKKVLRIIFKQRNKNVKEDMNFYRLYLKNLTGSETNARTVMNTNELEVHSCGEECGEALSDVMWFAVAYVIILFFTQYQI